MSEGANAQRVAFLRDGLELAAECAWSAVECASVEAQEGGVKWLDMGAERGDLECEVRFLLGIGLAVAHPERWEWLRPVGRAQTRLVVTQVLNEGLRGATLVGARRKGGCR